MPTLRTLSSLLCALPLLALPAAADSFDVTSLADNGPGSLRDALSQLPADRSSQIRFRVRGVIALESPLDVRGGVNLNLYGRDRVTLDGQGKTGILRAVEPGVRLSCEGLAFTRGATGRGGAVCFDSSSGSLTLQACVFTGNRAGRGGAVDVGSGRLRVFGCRFSGNRAVGAASAGMREPHGGAIFLGSAQAARVRGSEFVGNWADGLGGAIADAAISVGNALSGELRVDSSDLSGNVAGSAGGAIVVNARPLRIDGCSLANNSAPEGGAIHGFQGALELVQCTLFGNEALRGGGALTGRRVALGHCTLADNRPQGVEVRSDRFARGRVTVHDSVLVGSPEGDLVVGQGVDFLASRHNAYGSLRGGQGSASDRVGVALGQARLGPAERYGMVQVLPLGPGSALIDAGTPGAAGAPEFDARGRPFTRVRDGGVAARLDIGAFEVQEPFARVPLPLSEVSVPVERPTLTKNSGAEGPVLPQQSEAALGVTGVSKGDVTQKLSGRTNSSDPDAPRTSPQPSTSSNHPLLDRQAAQPAAAHVPRPPELPDDLQQAASPAQSGRTFEDRSATLAPRRGGAGLHQGSMNAIRNIRAAPAPTPGSGSEGGPAARPDPEPAPEPAREGGVEPAPAPAPAPAPPEPGATRSSATSGAASARP